ncbi:MAG TPA: hydantoinase/oxoprolinase N-terminal domain-containing protein, partial [Candidatus Poseidoniia archaeon]|nr:hydantoinase/oxoprolinase N-terminal domain-containing protein [Candidatus Poseidoniia archaeon]
MRIAVDVGGTFTDLVVIDSTGAVHRHKLLSTPPDFDTCVLAGIATVLDGNELDPASATIVNHGTTVATNAVLERCGARTALITTKGFRDVLELRRIRAPQIYDLFFVKT